MATGKNPAAASNTAPKKAPAPTKEATPTPDLPEAGTDGANLPALASGYNWKKDIIDEATGEVIKTVDRFKYLLGVPKQYRSDNKAGEFNINGVKSLGNTFTFQPIAWRVFQDDILNSGLKQWIELFFIDDKDCVSVIIFHGFSCENLLNMAAPLFYDDVTLADVIITAKLGQHESKAEGAKKAKYFIAEFTYEDGDPEKTKELQAYADEHQIYRRATLTPNAEYEAVHKFFNPYYDEDEPAQLTEGETSEA